MEAKFGVHSEVGSTPEGDGLRVGPVRTNA
jgi:hypothetical protein